MAALGPNPSGPSTWAAWYRVKAPRRGTPCPHCGRPLESPHRLERCYHCGKELQSSGWRGAKIGGWLSSLLLRFALLIALLLGATYLFFFLFSS